ncbi:MAG: GreA/GreB family elongation factor [Ignavibacteriaceae bacterium]|nr:GreA/GreB family elongation factor [Ignavibacteriaceae bacterium]
MKPVISNTDYVTLKSLIVNCPPHLKSKELGQMMDELDKAEVVTDKKIGNDVIKLNSLFEAEDLSTNKIWKLMLTLPGEANLKEQKISVFSPLGVALIGFKKGMTIQSALPGGMKKFKILNVVNE